MWTLAFFFCNLLLSQNFVLRKTKTSKLLSQALCSKGLVTRGNFCRQLQSNQLQHIYTITFVAHESILKHCLTIHKRNILTFKWECLFILEIAWNWLLEIVPRVTWP